MSRPAVTCVTLGILALLTAGCGGGSTPGGRLRAVVDTVDGVPRITYPARGEGTLPWTVDTLAVIGDIMGNDDNYQFDQVPNSGIAGDRHGDVFVLDVNGGRVLAYDSTGKFHASYGRKGNGPGELQQPFALRVGAADTVWVLEPMSRRLTGFPVAGGDPRVMVLSTSILAGPPLATRPDGFIMQGFNMPVFGKAGGVSNDGAPVIPLLRVDRPATVIDTLWSAPAPEQQLVQSKSGNAIMVTVVTPEFQPQFRWALLAAGGVVLAEDDSYTLRLLASDGREVLRVARDMPPRPTTDADRQAARERVRASASRARIGGRKAPEEMIRARLERMTFAPTIPRITGIVVDPQNRIWVGVSLQQPDSTEQIDVFQADGTLLGSLHGVPLPLTFLGHDLAADLRKDPDTDVQQAVVFRIRETPAN